MVGYYARCYIGAQVSTDDFVESTKQTRVLCDHPEAEGQKFCPVCGKREDQRTKVEEVKAWRPGMKAAIDKLAERWGCEPEQITWSDFREYDDVEFAGLRMLFLRTSSMDRDETMLLGFPIAHIDPEGGGWSSRPHRNPASTPESVAVDHFAAVHKGLAELGISDRTVSIWTLSYCSV